MLLSQIQKRTLWKNPEIIIDEISYQSRKGSLFNLIKSISEKPTANHILDTEIVNISPERLGSVQLKSP